MNPGMNQGMSPGDQNQDLQDQFADICLAKFLQSFPELGPFILTFKDCSDEMGEDPSVRVGLFILRPGAELLYVPVVARSDNVYPIDSIFIDSQQKFFPLSKKTVQFILAMSATDTSALGKSKTIPETVNTNPSTYWLLNPPRTGKFVYASRSRLVEFLAQLPYEVKDEVFEKLSAEKSVYDNLDEQFGLKAIFDVLKAPSMAALPQATNQVPISIATADNQAAGLGEVQINSILDDGYHFIGKQPTYRVAVSAQNYDVDGVFKAVTDLDGGKDYDVAFANGTSREAFIPKMNANGSNHIPMAIFTNGDYALGKSFIAVGQELDRREVLKVLFDMNPPVMLKDLYMNDTFTIMLGDGTFLGPYQAANVVLSSLGIEAKVYNLATGKVEHLYAYRNFQGQYDRVSYDIYIPFTAIVIKLGSDVSLELECSTNAAWKKREANQLKLLSDELNIGYDGVEFAVNGSPVGSEPDLMERLVIKEGIDPDVAKSFVKEAKLSKFAKIYMTKQAFSTDENYANVPQYGQVPDDSSKDVGMNGAFLPRVANSAELGDAQTTEATIISELLQVPDVIIEIGEYLPDIEEAVDKLGRILFMSRVHIDRLADANDADSIFSFLASLKTAYITLGQNLMKLKNMVNVHQALDETVGAAGE